MDWNTLCINYVYLCSPHINCIREIWTRASIIAVTVHIYHNIATIRTKQKVNQKTLPIASTHTNSGLESWSGQYFLSELQEYYNLFIWLALLWLCGYYKSYIKLLQLGQSNCNKIIVLCSNQKALFTFKIDFVELNHLQFTNGKLFFRLKLRNPSIISRLANIKQFINHTI